MVQKKYLILDKYLSVFAIHFADIFDTLGRPFWSENVSKMIAKSCKKHLLFSSSFSDQIFCKLWTRSCLCFGSGSALLRSWWRSHRFPIRFASDPLRSWCVHFESLASSLSLRFGPADVRFGSRTLRIGSAAVPLALASIIFRFASGPLWFRFAPVGVRFGFRSLRPRPTAVPLVFASVPFRLRVGSVSAPLAFASIP